MLSTAWPASTLTAVGEQWKSNGVGQRGADYERSLGVDGHCLVLDAGPTSYGCVERWAIAGSTIVIRLTTAGSDELGVTTIRIEVPEDAAAATASALHRLIDDGPEVDDFTVVRRP